MESWHLTVIILGIVVFSLLTGTVHARSAAIGFFDGEGMIGVEDENGNYREIVARPTVRYKQWLNDRDALEVSGELQTAGESNFQFSALYLHHLSENKITPYVGGGLSWAETGSAIDKDFVSLDFPVGFEWKFEESPVALGIHTTGLLILSPEADISLGQRIDFGLYYYF